MHFYSKTGRIQWLPPFPSVFGHLLELLRDVCVHEINRDVLRKVKLCIYDEVVCTYDIYEVAVDEGTQKPVIMCNRVDDDKLDLFEQNNTWTDRVEGQKCKRAKDKDLARTSKPKTSGQTRLRGCVRPRELERDTRLAPFVHK